MEFPGEDSGDGKDEETEVDSTSSMIDVRLTEIAKKMPIFEPEDRVDSSALERPLIINLDLALYRAKMLARNFQYDEAQQVLRKVSFSLKYWDSYYYYIFLSNFGGYDQTLNSNKKWLKQA